MDDLFLHHVKDIYYAEEQIINQTCSSVAIFQLKLPVRLRR
jgi:ferritin-like metal-binding protein YciE